MSVEQLTAMAPHKRQYWVNRAIATMNQEAEARRLHAVWQESQRK